MVLQIISNLFLMKKSFHKSYYTFFNASKLNRILLITNTNSKHPCYFNKYLRQYILSVYTPSNAAIRKVDASGSQTWMVSFAFSPIVKSLSVDAAEQSVYLASRANPLIVAKLSASSGLIVSQHQLYVDI